MGSSRVEEGWILNGGRPLLLKLIYDSSSSTNRTFLLSKAGRYSKASPQRTPFSSRRTPYPTTRTPLNSLDVHPFQNENEVHNKLFLNRGTSFAADLQNSKYMISIYLSPNRLKTTSLQLKLFSQRAI